MAARSKPLSRRVFLKHVGHVGLAALAAPSLAAAGPEPKFGAYLFAHMMKQDYGRLYYEQYPGVSYGCSTAPSIDGPWHDLYWQQYDVPADARHGSMIPITSGTSADSIARMLSNRFA